MVKASTPFGYLRKLRDLFRRRPERRSSLPWANFCRSEAASATPGEKTIFPLLPEPKRR